MPSSAPATTRSSRPACADRAGGSGWHTAVGARTGAGTRSRMDARILLVEDDPSIREVTAIGLRNAGFTVETAADRAAGLQRFKSEPFDLVLLDVMLPRLDGLEVCRAIRRTSTIPVVMLTARADTIDVVVRLEAGADDYVRPRMSGTTRSGSPLRADRPRDRQRPSRVARAVFVRGGAGSLSRRGWCSMVSANPASPSARRRTTCPRNPVRSCRRPCRRRRSSRAGSRCR
jgi:CheY-like chemotaxis protein